jgi:hypothetical protein
MQLRHNFFSVATARQLHEGKETAPNRATKTKTNCYRGCPWDDAKVCRYFPWFTQSSTIMCSGLAAHDLPYLPAVMLADLASSGLAVQTHASHPRHDLAICT